MEFNYEYGNNDVDSKLKYGLSNNHTVQAIYTRCNDSLPNPLLEALPTPIDTTVIKSMYFKAMDISTLKATSTEEIINQILKLRDFRMPLPFMAKMEMQFSLSLQISCKKRLEYLLRTPVEIIMNNQELSQGIVSKTVTGGDTGIGLSLLGVGGCGKTEAITTMLTRYPQIIKHNIEGVGKFVQIVYITVVTPANANLNDLYTAIAEAIDEALGNATPVYGKTILSKRSVGSKARYIAKLIRIFNICSLILDEVQNLDNRRNKEDSYNSLMEIINTTKVSLVLVGTEEAYSILCKKQYLARRTGDIIDASKYCYDYEKFCIRMKELMKFNWIDPENIILSNSDIFKALYEETSGTIDRMVSLWIDVQLAYITSKVKPIITGDFIRIISARTNPLLAHFTAEALEYSPFSLISKEAAANNESYVPVMDNTEATAMAKMLTQKKAESLLFEKLATSGNPDQARRVFERVKETLIYLGKNYRDDTIIDNIVRIMKRKDSQGADDIQLVQKTLKSLERKRSDSRPSKAINKSKASDIVTSFSNEFID